MLSLFPIVTLMFEAARVIELRLEQIALGRSTPTEMLLMATEKIDALQQARAIIIGGGDQRQVVEHYRKVVSANLVRLSEPTISRTNAPSRVETR